MESDQASCPKKELPTTAMESLVTQTIISTKNTTSQPPTQPATATSRVEKPKSSGVTSKKAPARPTSPTLLTREEMLKDFPKHLWPPPLPPMPPYTPPFNQVKGLAASASQASTPQTPKKPSVSPPPAPKPQPSKNPKPYIPDATTAAALPTLEDETPQKSMLEFVTAAEKLSARICDIVIDDTDIDDPVLDDTLTDNEDEEEIWMREFHRRHNTYVEIMDSIKSLLKAMQEKGLDENTFDGTPIGEKFKFGVKLAKTMDGQEVAWEEGEEQYKQMAQSMLADFEIVKLMVDKDAVFGEKLLVPDNEEEEEEWMRRCLRLC